MALGYQKFGHGEHRVIALHGWFGDHTAFDPMRQSLSAGDFTYIFPAYRGYGLSRHLTGDYTNKEIATDVLALADDLGWDTFSLVGHSMGGKAIQRVLADAPGRVRKMVAVTPVPAAAVPFDDATRALFDSAANNMDARRGIMGYAVANRLSQAWIEHMADYSARTATIDAFGAYLRAWANEEFVGDVAGNTVPVKVIIGQHDASLNEDVMRGTFLAWYPNSELEIIPNAGHYPMDETPVALATAIESFLRK